MRPVHEVVGFANLITYAIIIVSVNELEQKKQTAILWKAYERLLLKFPPVESLEKVYYFTYKIKHYLRIFTRNKGLTKLEV